MTVPRQETVSVMLAEPFNVPAARQAARDALEAGKRVAVIATRRGERCAVFSARPIPGGVFLTSIMPQCRGRRGNIREAVSDGFGILDAVFRHEGAPDRMHG